MDSIPSCYTTQMRVRINPPLVVTVRWYWAPPGAKPFPGPHAFGSSLWETDWLKSDNGDLGELPTGHTWVAGTTPAGITGQATPTPLSWYQTGVPASVTSSYPNPPCVVPSFTDLWAWLRPQSLTRGIFGYVTETPWPDSSPNLLPWDWQPGTSPAAGSVAPGGDGPRGSAPYLHCVQTPPFSPSAFDYLRRTASTLPGPAYTGFAVLRNGTWPHGQFCTVGTLKIGGLQPPPGGLFLLDTTYGVSTNTAAPDDGAWHVYATRCDGVGTVDLWADARKLASFSVQTVPHPLVGAFAFASGLFSQSPLQTDLSEVMIYTRHLTDAEMAYAFNYLAPRPITPPIVDYTDMLVGSIVLDAGTDTLPPLFLPCNGMAVSRTSYSLLFGRIGTSYGAGDGVHTFNLPNLDGRILYGSGLTYATGQAVGADHPVLAAAQLPAHTHPVTDPGHQHRSPSGGAYAEFLAGGGEAVGSGPDRLQNSGLNLTQAATTGLSVGANTGGGSPLDVRQQGLALRPLIYAGQ